MKEFFVLIKTDNKNNDVYCEFYSSRKKALESIATIHSLDLKEFLEFYSELDTDEFNFFDETINDSFYLRKFSIDQIR